MKKIILYISILSSLLVSIQNNAQSRRDGQIILNQPTVTINDMQYINGQSINSSEPVKITIGSNSRILFGVYLDNPNAWQGTLKVYTKKSSNDTPIQRGGTDYISTGTYSFSSSRDITLYASNFNASGGTLYAEFEGTGGVKYASSSYSIQVVTPPDPDITNNNISGNQTINEGDNVSTITGSNPSGGNGSYTYQWEKQTTGTWNPISGANSKNYLPNNVNTTTKFRRIVLSGNAENSISNTVTITVIPLPNISNNYITFDGNSTFIGSLPTGGNGTYSYKWYSYVPSIGDPQLFPGHTGKDLTLSPEQIEAANELYIYFSREVTSYNKVSLSNWEGVNGSMDIQNNTISFDGVNTFIGSIPTGGDGVYNYQWYNFIPESGADPMPISGQTNKDLVLNPAQIEAANTYNIYFSRRVTSLNETSYSIYVGINGPFAGRSNGNFNDKDVNLIKDFDLIYKTPLEIFEKKDYLNDNQSLIVYPNPSTDKKININYSANKLNASATKDVEIYTIVGTKVFSKELNNNSSQLDLSNLPSGIYVLQFTSGDYSITKKIILK